MTAPYSGRIPGRVDVRGLIAAAVAAGLPAGLVYALAGLLLAEPALLRAEVFEAAGGAPSLGPGRALAGLAGALAVATAFSLILTPIVRALGPPTLGRGLMVGAGAFAALFLLPALATLPGPPGVEPAQSLAARQGAWLLAVLAFGAAVGAGLLARRLAGTARAGRWLGWAVGLGVWAIWAALYVRTAGGLTALAAGPGPVPSALVARFREGMVGANLMLFLGLALLIPPALRRLSP